MNNTNILISGASVGGPALAYWLNRYGFNVTVVEKAPALRLGGQAVDFKGETHLTVLERMGILEDVRRLQTGGTDQEIVDANDRTLAVMPGEFTGGELEIGRGDLSRLLYEKTLAAGCEYVFGDSITSLTETASGVHVTFERGAPRTFDLVVGADGIHSNVRRLVFGPESDYVSFLGYYYALADIPKNFGAVAKMYNEPGRLVSTGGPAASAFFAFASPRLDYDRYDIEEMKRIVIDAYAGMGWRTPAIIEAVRRADNFYLDSISQVRIDHYSKGRVVLLGDSAYGNTLGGFGTGLAMVGAYVLAGELAEASGDHRVAFQRYEEEFRDYAKIAKNGNAGPFLAPRTRRGIRMRNWLFKSGPLLKIMMKMTDKFATNITLKDYPSLVRR
ncbi:FAD-dependent monooxygenase [Microtetraspora sp. NBRC 16547]|uniref:FAD-dependent monooxygenase n=1 Tax=Microtetraspora sp. NBRC 16547 TaxID=3030993 RepID=UPI0024A03E6B|nr:FAD-dependent monooxygenase [Microtetraspora sp. NBRC 16547]GLW99510.1 FAD-dependent oxidoreductase [Microtetraspora sp. NBRC 16547]